MKFLNENVVDNTEDYKFDKKKLCEGVGVTCCISANDVLEIEASLLSTICFSMALICLLFSSISCSS